MLIGRVQALYPHTYGHAKIHSELSSLFEPTSGVRQECRISPFLFNFAIEEMIKNA